MTKLIQNDRLKGYRFTVSNPPQAGDRVRVLGDLATVASMSPHGELRFTDRRQSWHLWASPEMSACTLHEAVKAIPKEPTAPMQRAVLDLLRRKGAITSMEAQGVLRCRQLPARILELKRLGHGIVTQMKLDHTGQKYARYHLEVAAA
ncbi:helix-turn-helix domain-containing protein [Mesorhizobium sp. M7A.F.Ca.CA.004.02.1.1]|uniref:helix-turn-helix domain-containing protein n=1 Tax=Mesorhizobium sp. M7A.F.Ca.CA.004.02.1.1 TaxID=2496690 RepID=UPI0013DF4A1E|nr:helix-turn-helix domain-containing protein [Mesorhizobium sp. M7A.F.Ca.CA.004.02.1.1]